MVGDANEDQGMKMATVGDANKGQGTKMAMVGDADNDQGMKIATVGDAFFLFVKGLWCATLSVTVQESISHYLREEFEILLCGDFKGL